MIVRPSLETDLAACQAIYAHHVAHGTGTFEESAPSVEQLAERRRAVLGYGCPWLVAEADGQVIGFAYAGPFRARSAYRYTVEDSLYVASDRVGQGVGKALLTELVSICEAMGLRQMVAVIGDSANAGSIGVHAACGFEHTGVLKDTGFKHGRFLDVVFMQRALNSGGQGAPDGDGLSL